MGRFCFYILLCFVIPAGCFQFRRTPSKPLVVNYKNRTNVELKWEWTMASNEVLALLKIKRYRKNHANTEVVLATFYSSGNIKIDTTKYGLTVNNVVNGYASFVIKDLTNQGQGVNVMSENEIYVYKIVVDEQTQATEHDDEVELKVFRIPYITTYPRNQTATRGTITFECAAGGKPTPTITWEKIGSSQSLTPGSTLTITNFAEGKIGVYKCTARSTGLIESASATGSVQFATCGSGCNKQELGIEFTNLKYKSNASYQDLKNRIQTECLNLYALKNKIIHTCQVPRFRSGSLVAVVELGSPTNYVGDPTQPLREAISGGNFAGYPVRNTFVSPTIPTVAPTQSSTRRLTRSSEITGIPTTGPTASTRRLTRSSEITGIPTTVSTRRLTRSSEITGIPTTVSVSGTSEVASTCSLAIGICVTIIILALLFNAVLGFLLWSKSSQLKELAKNRIQLDKSPYEHPDIAANYSSDAFITNRQPEEPTAPIYHEIFNSNDNANDNTNQGYNQALDDIRQQPCQTYQSLDNAKTNATNL